MPLSFRRNASSSDRAERSPTGTITIALVILAVLVGGLVLIAQGFSWDS